MLLAAHNIDMPRVVKRKLGAKFALGRVSLCGRQAKLVLEHFEEFLQFLPILDLQAITTCIKSFIELWNLLSMPVPPEQRTSKATQVKVQGQRWVSQFCQLTSSAEATWYMRALLCEIPRLINECPVDIHLASAMSGEQGSTILRLCTLLQ